MSDDADSMKPDALAQADEVRDRLLKVLGSGLMSSVADRLGPGRQEDVLEALLCGVIGVAAGLAAVMVDGDDHDEQLADWVRRAFLANLGVARRATTALRAGCRGSA